MTKRKTLSLCMIVKNEAEWLQRCLDAHTGLFDQIVIVDTGSTDGTPDIARKSAHAFANFEWCDDFSAARNFSLSKATQDWILVLDADEVIDQKDWPKIRHLIQNSEDQAYTFIQRTYSNNNELLGWVCDQSPNPYGVQTLGYFDTPIVRLIPNNPQLGLRYVQRIHEGIEYTDPNKKPVNSDIVLHHYGYLKSAEQLQNKFSLYYKLEQKRVAENPNDAEGWRQFGAACAERKNWQDSLSAYEKSITLEDNNFGGLYGAALAAFQLGNYPRVLERINQAKSLQPGHSFLFHLQGSIHFSQNDYASAQESFSQALLINPNDVTSLYNLGVAHMRQNKLSEAKELLERTLKLNSVHTSALYNLALVLFFLNEKNRAIKTLEDLIGLSPQDNEAKQLLDKFKAAND